jgi:hypothetical protein
MSVIQTSSAPAQLTTEQMNLAKELMMCHGTIRVTREANGLHFYLACPTCLKEEGEDELWKMHLAVNVDRYLNGHTGAAMCMKCRQTFMIDQLTMWPPLEKRGYERGPAKIVDQKMIDVDFLEPDSKGRMVPKGPGETVPLSQLPPDHPALLYLHSRQFSAADLEHQFNASFCWKQREDMKYRKLLGGFRATPQNRIIFEILQDGVRVGWQARILEMEHEQTLFYYHPYKDTWVEVKCRNNVTGGWDPLEGWQDWDPSKWIMSHGAKRNSCLMGYDAARAFNAARPGKRRWCFITEGPLDAARLGPPALAVCGKYCSEEQAALLADAFDTLIVVPDRDEAGSKLPAGVCERIGGSRNVIVILPPANRKDAGEMTREEAQLFRVGAMMKAGVL